MFLYFFKPQLAMVYCVTLDIVCRSIFLAKERFSVQMQETPKWKKSLEVYNCSFHAPKIWSFICKYLGIRFKFYSCSKIPFHNHTILLKCSNQFIIWWLYFLFFFSNISLAGCPEFACDGFCLPWSRYCDKNIDCPSQEDEHEFCGKILSTLPT